MKIKYFYQQMLAFFVVMITLLIIMTVIFLEFTRNSTYHDTEELLFGYAEALVDGDLQEDQLEDAQFVLQNQEVVVTVFNSENQMAYPSTAVSYSSGISDENFAQLKNGERITLTIQDKDFFGNQVEIALVYLPFFSQTNGDFAGFIGISSPISGIEENLREMRSNLFTAFVISSLGAIVIALLFTRYQVGRINRLRNATHRVAKGDFEVHLESSGQDEFDDLAKDFNSMARSLKESQQEIERQEDRRRQFMADAAHEMRTPLTTINGLLEGLEHDMIPENQKTRSLQLMQNETRRLIRLVNENLDYEKIRSNQIYLRKQSFNAYNALETIVEQLKGKAQSANNQLQFSCSEELEFYADYDRFVQIVVNLVQNAIQFTENGLITITAEKDLEGSIITITDTGIGMTEEEVRNIWERYYKADASRKSTKYGESGLGLAIVHQLVQLHGGKISVKSEVGKGSTFTIIFPAKSKLNTPEK
ncbi:ATP-binding protein [Desemzia sp. FAM 23991]|uniref:ATP-binding protein n=1 Tax=unclassified Desemzia TaxID=2685243 RepID=UPI0038846B7D